MIARLKKEEQEREHRRVIKHDSDVAARVFTASDRASKALSDADKALR